MKNPLDDLFVPYELAYTAKQKEFDKPCFGLFNPIKELCYPQLHYGEWKSFIDQQDQRWITPAPTYQQVVDWLRETHSIEITQVPSIKLEKGFYQFDITRDKPHHEDLVSGKDYYKVYQKAIKEAFKLIKKNKYLN